MYVNWFFSNSEKEIYCLYLLPRSSNGKVNAEFLLMYTNSVKQCVECTVLYLALEILSKMKRVNIEDYDVCNRFG